MELILTSIRPMNIAASTTVFQIPVKTTRTRSVARILDYKGPSLFYERNCLAYAWVFPIIPTNHLHLMERQEEAFIYLGKQSHCVEWPRAAHRARKWKSCFGFSLVYSAPWMGKKPKEQMGMLLWEQTFVSAIMTFNQLLVLAWKHWPSSGDAHSLHIALPLSYSVAM